MATPLKLQLRNKPVLSLQKNAEIAGGNSRARSTLSSAWPGLVSEGATSGVASRNFGLGGSAVKDNFYSVNEPRSLLALK